MSNECYGRTPEVDSTCINIGICSLNNALIVMLSTMYVHISIWFCVDIDIHIHVNVLPVWLTFGIRVWLPEWVKSCNYWLSLIKWQWKLNYREERMTGNIVPRFIYTAVCITEMYGAVTRYAFHPMDENCASIGWKGFDNTQSLYKYRPQILNKVSSYTACMWFWSYDLSVCV